MSELRDYFYSGKGRTIHKLEHYFDVYERHFSRLRNKPITMLEVGVSHGGSLQMWREYFGPSATIIGVDIDPECRIMESEGFQIFIGDQGDKVFWADVKSKIPKLDLLIDDGSHRLNHQCITFDAMYPHVKDDGGIFLVEDCHSSYRKAFGGGHRKRHTFVEYAKDMVDEINATWSQNDSLMTTQLTRTCASISFYDAVIVFEKAVREPPFNVYGGKDPGRFTPRRSRTPGNELPEVSSLPPAGSSRRRPLKKNVESQGSKKPLKRLLNLVGIK